jgi:ketosteroid isomerase-like protein
MRERDRLIVEALYTSWEAGDLKSMLRHVAKDVEFAVHPWHRASYIGRGSGKPLLLARLQQFLAAYEVVDYHAPPPVALADGTLDCRVSYHYRHRRSGMTIDGNMRHVWRLSGGTIKALDVIHDAKRMGAFFELAEASQPFSGE